MWNVVAEYVDHQMPVWWKTIPCLEFSQTKDRVGFADYLYEYFSEGNKKLISGGVDYRVAAVWEGSLRLYLELKNNEGNLEYSGETKLLELLSAFNAAPSS